MRTIVIALLVNLAVAVIKAVAGVLTASAGLLAEAAHSVGDCTTELLLATAIRRSRRQPDRRHPFGYGKERYFWSLLAALAIFTMGAGYSVYEGLTTIIAGERDAAPATVGYLVVGASMLVECVSLIQASRQVRRASRRADMSVHAYVRDPDDPTVKSVLLEDIAALIGLAVAGGGLILRQVTGDPFWDGLAALLIGALLIVIAYELARTNVGLLIGKQANPALVRAIRDALARQPDVLGVVDVLTMMIGTGQVLVCARVDYREDLTASQAEQACVRLHIMLKDQFEDIDEVFIEPVPRDNPELQRQAAVRRRAAD
jgi:cation diffusion facilitator family transporter